MDSELATPCSLSSNNPPSPSPKEPFFFPVFLILNGNISSGKSTLLDSLGLEKDIADSILIVKEPLEKFADLLPLYYNDPQKFGMMIQSSITLAHFFNYFKIIESVKRMAESHSSSSSSSSLNPIRLVIFERTYHSVKIFSDCLELQPQELQALDDMIKEIDLFIESVFRSSRLSFFHLKPFHVYLKTRVEDCLERIQVRNRSGEEKITLEYLKKLEESHTSFYKKITSDPIKVIDGSQSKEQVLSQMKELIVDLIKE